MAKSTPAYNTTKAALNMLTVQYALSLESEGFTVFCVSPGVCANISFQLETKVIETMLI